jgi:hypothetical protein
MLCISIITYLAYLHPTKSYLVLDYPSFHYLRFKLWALSCGRRDLINKPNIYHRNYQLCACHFENKMFSNPQKSRLVFDALPTNRLRGTIRSPYSSTPPHRFTSQREVSPKPSTSQREVSPQPSSSERKVSPQPSSSEREVSPQPSTSQREVSPRPSTSLGEVTPRPSTSRYYATVGGVSLPMGTSVSTQTGLTLSSSTPRKQDLRRQFLWSGQYKNLKTATV